MNISNPLANKRRVGTGAGIGNAFDVDDDTAYRRWRTEKLSDYRSQASDLIVKIDNPCTLTTEEKSALLTRCRRTNMVIYELCNPSHGTKFSIEALGRQFGLYQLDDNLCADDDGITSLRVREDGRNKEYIPYSNRALNWHTDGYYNDSNQRIRSFVLHCVQDAAEGGVNGLMDHEIAYILLRDENPDYIRALMEPDAMTIPANVENGKMIRPDQTGPVFIVEPLTGNLLMRYTARARNIVWKQNPVTRQAIEFLRHSLAEDSTYRLNHRLTPGQGLLSNNVLHNRSAFTDEPATGRQRLMFRARYYNRIAGTDFNEVYGREGAHAVA